MVRKFKIKTGKYKGRIVNGEITKPKNVKTSFGNYYFEPNTIVEIMKDWVVVFDGTSNVVLPREEYKSDSEWVDAELIDQFHDMDEAFDFAEIENQKMPLK